jgi:hypothetical protein
MRIQQHFSKTTDYGGVIFTMTMLSKLLRNRKFLVVYTMNLHRRMRMASCPEWTTLTLIFLGRYLKGNHLGNKAMTPSLFMYFKECNVTHISLTGQWHHTSSRDKPKATRHMPLLDIRLIILCFQTDVSVLTLHQLQGTIFLLARMYTFIQVLQQKLCGASS